MEINKYMAPELKLLGMLWYGIEPTIWKNKWNVLDENKEVVGAITRKKLAKANKKDDTKDIYGYVTEIDSDVIKYNDTMVINKAQNRYMIFKTSSKNSFLNVKKLYNHSVNPLNFWSFFELKKVK